MWRVQQMGGHLDRYYVLDPDRDMPDDSRLSLHWPVGRDNNFNSEGAAITMCDVFNARDYPEAPLVTPVTNNRQTSDAEASAPKPLAVDLPN